jgi:hypothetical protein
MYKRVDVTLGLLSKGRTLCRVSWEEYLRFVLREKQETGNGKINEECLIKNSIKAPVEFSVCITNYALRHEDMLTVVAGGIRCMNPYFLDLQSTWR